MKQSQCNRTIVIYTYACCIFNAQEPRERFPQHRWESKKLQARRSRYARSDLVGSALVNTQLLYTRSVFACTKRGHDPARIHRIDMFAVPPHSIAGVWLETR